MPIKCGRNAAHCYLKPKRHSDFTEMLQVICIAHRPVHRSTTSALPQQWTHLQKIAAVTFSITLARNFTHANAWIRLRKPHRYFLYSTNVSAPFIIAILNPPLYKGQIAHLRSRLLTEYNHGHSDILTLYISAIFVFFTALVLKKTPGAWETSAG